MDASAPLTGANIVRTGFAPCDAPDAADQLVAALGPDPFALVILFVSPRTNLDTFFAGIKGRFGAAEVVGCTTAGELTATGYTEGEIVAVGLPASHFAARTLFIEDLTRIQAEARITDMIHNRKALAASHPTWTSEFAFLMVDGLSTREDALAADLSEGLGPVARVGGPGGGGGAGGGEGSPPGEWVRGWGLWVGIGGGRDGGSFRGLWRQRPLRPRRVGRIGANDLGTRYSVWNGRVCDG